MKGEGRMENPRTFSERRFYPSPFLLKATFPPLEEKIQPQSVSVFTIINAD